MPGWGGRRDEVPRAKYEDFLAHHGWEVSFLKSQSTTQSASPWALSIAFFPICNSSAMGDSEIADFLLFL
jgi:hypothetical protein